MKASNSNSTSPTLSPPGTMNNLITALTTDLYQITMLYAYYKTNRHNDTATFELFFRKNPFPGGSFCIFCGLDRVLQFLSGFKITDDDIRYLRSTPALQNCDNGFFDYLKALDCSKVKVYACEQGRMVFPRVPLLTVTGPLGITQLIETALLNMANFASLVGTNAARMVIAARKGTPKPPKLVEFGLRRAQGPDGAFTATQYSIVGGFDGTSNVLAGKLLNIPISGTHAHSFVQAHASLDEVAHLALFDKNLEKKSLLLPLVLKYRQTLWKDIHTNDGELAAFVAYAISFPDAFLCLVDTYDTLLSGVRNFIYVALALNDLGYIPRGIRLDSGDLAFLSKQCRKVFEKVADQYDRECFRRLDIVASNDINESVLYSLNEVGHAITIFGIGTNLVTCQAQPALGCVYKLVELNHKPRLKLSQETEKILIPGQKIPHRIYSGGTPLLDILMAEKEELQKGFSVSCYNPFSSEKVDVVVDRVEKLHQLVFNGGIVPGSVPDLMESRKFVLEQIETMKPELFQHDNPEHYEVTVSELVHENFQEMLNQAKMH